MSRPPPSNMFPGLMLLSSWDPGLPSGWSDSFSSTKEVLITHKLQAVFHPNGCQWLHGWATHSVNKIIILWFCVSADCALLQSSAPALGGTRRYQRESTTAASKLIGFRQERKRQWEEGNKAKHDHNSIISLPGSVRCLSANDAGSRWPDALPLVSKVVSPPSFKRKLSRRRC